MFYFSYGSNMSSLRLLTRVSTANFVTVAALYGHELKYHKVSQVDGSGKCDIYFTNDPAHIVHGVVYEIHKAGKKVLDKIEGLGVGYDEKTVTLNAGDNTVLEAHTYCATTIDSAIKPYLWYKEHVMRGAREFALPRHYIARYVDVAAMEDSDKDRHVRELAIYNKGVGT